MTETLEMRLVCELSGPGGFAHAGFSARRPGIRSGGGLRPCRRLRPAGRSLERSAAGWRRLSGVPFLARKISLETVLFFRANFNSLRHSLPGSRMVRILPLSAISARPGRAASTVRQRTSDTRMPVEQIVSSSRARHSCPRLWAVSSRHSYSGRVSARRASRKRRRWTFRNFSRHSPQSPGSGTACSGRPAWR